MRFRNSAAAPPPPAPGTPTVQGHSFARLKRVRAGFQFRAFAGNTVLSAPRAATGEAHKKGKSEPPSNVLYRSLNQCCSLGSLPWKQRDNDIEVGAREPWMITCQNIRELPEIAVDNAKGNVDAMADQICGLTPEDWYRGLSLLRYAFRQKGTIEQNKPIAKNVVNMVASQPQWFLPEEKSDNSDTLLHTLTKAEDALKRRKSSRLSASEFGSKAHDNT
ncbi:MAG: hypothetical protein Q9171_002973 [Xanthocarpia ochracea]